MPNIMNIEKTMRQLKVSPKIIAQMGFGREQYFSEWQLQSIITVLDNMEKRLTKEQILAVMERQGCHKTGKYDKKYKTFGKENAEKPLSEKLKTAVDTAFDSDIPYINDIGNIVLEVRCYIDGDNSAFSLASYHCASRIAKADKPLRIPHTFCGCCAGHKMYHWQNALGIKLQLFSIDISPNKNEKSPMRVFTYKIIN